MQFHYFSLGNVHIFLVIEKMNDYSYKPIISKQIVLTWFQLHALYVDALYVAIKSPCACAFMKIGAGSAQT